MYLKISDKQPAFLFPSNCAKKTSLRWKAITSAALKASTSGPFLALLAIEIIVPTSISAKLEQWLQAYIVYIGITDPKLCSPLTKPDVVGNRRTSLQS